MWPKLTFLPFEEKPSRVNTRFRNNLSEFTSYLKRVVVEMTQKHYASKKVFCGIRSQTNIKIWILSKSSRFRSNNGILLPVAVESVNSQILGFFGIKESSLDFAYGVVWVWVDYLTSIHPEIIRKSIIFWWFQGRVGA